MKKIILISGMVFTAFLMACDSNQQDSSMERAEEINEEREAVPDDAAEFATKAAANGMFEVEAGKMAQQQATNADVKNFAQQMVNDHTAANEELKQLASSLNIALPQSITEDQRDKLNNLREKQGVDFDKEYMDMMVSDHKDSVDNFENAAEDSKSADLKNWASQKLPTLKNHLQMAEQLHEKVKEMK